MIRVAIVEDDAEVQGVLQEYVRRYTRQYGTEFEVTLFADGVDILDDYRAVYDIIFLDVEMKHLDGMTTAERIRQMDADVILIFITNMAQYAIGGYAVGALDYVLKPVPYFAFSQQLRKAEEQLRRRARHYLALPVEGGMRRLDSSLIYYLESEGHRVHFYTEEGDFVAAGTLKAFEELGVEAVEQCLPSWDLDGMRFVRSKVDLQVMLDESVHTPIDAAKACKIDAADIINIKLMKCGGLYPAEKINAIAEANHVQCMVGCMLETKVAIAAGVSLVAAKQNITEADCDSFMYAVDPEMGMPGGFAVNGGVYTLSDKPGLGIDIDF